MSALFLTCFYAREDRLGLKYRCTILAKIRDISLRSRPSFWPIS